MWTTLAAALLVTLSPLKPSSGIIFCTDLWENCTADNCRSPRDYPESMEMIHNCARTCCVCTYNQLVLSANRTKVIPSSNNHVTTLPVDGRTFNDPGIWGDCFYFNDTERTSTQVFCVELDRSQIVRVVTLFMQYGGADVEVEVGVGMGSCSSVDVTPNFNEFACNAFTLRRGSTSGRVQCSGDTIGNYIVVRSQWLSLCEVVYGDMDSSRPYCSLGYYSNGSSLCLPCANLCTFTPSSVHCDYSTPEKEVCRHYPHCSNTDSGGHTGVTSGLLCDEPCDEDRCVRAVRGPACDRWSGLCLGQCSLHHYGGNCARTCWKCLQECNRLGDCLTGGVCLNSSYGLECQKVCYCPGGCTRWDGTCWEETCAQGFYGDLCKRKCPGCLNGCQRDTGLCKMGGCNMRFWGNRCTQSCPTCLSECYPHNGRCRGGCMVGFYGPYCSQECLTCNVGCDANGVCTQGCIMGYYGQYCEFKCPNCLGACDQGGGRCRIGCNFGFWGSHCEDPCDCGNQSCTQRSGRCAGATSTSVTTPAPAVLQMGEADSNDDIFIVVLAMVVAFHLSFIGGSYVYRAYRRYRVVTFPPSDEFTIIQPDPLPTTDPDVYYVDPCYCISEEDIHSQLYHRQPRCSGYRSGNTN